jgi:hypothetical protein
MKILNSFLKIVAAALLLAGSAVAQVPSCYPPVGQNVKLHKDPLQQTIPVSFWCPPTEAYMDWKLVLGFMKLSALTAADQQAIIPAVMGDDKLSMVTLIGKSLVVDSTEWQAARDRIYPAVLATEPPVYDTVMVGGSSWAVMLNGPDAGKRFTGGAADPVVPTEARAACGKLMIKEANGDVYCNWRREPNGRYPNLVGLVKRLPR